MFRTPDELRKRNIEIIAEIKAMLDDFETQRCFGVHKELDLNYKLDDAAAKLRLAEYYYRLPVRSE